MFIYDAVASILHKINVGKKYSVTIYMTGNTGLYKANSDYTQGLEKLLKI